MPGLVENRRKWSEHNWEHGGHRWSPGGTTAGTDLMWARTIAPRIGAWLPTGTILEIAPGYGRWTAYLLAACNRLVGVDITDRCVQICSERFAALPHAEFATNDGESLPMVGDSSIDFAFSLDSLVHVEAPQIRRYLFELARTLKPGGAAFLHHSNLGAYREGDGPVPAYVRERHWRAQSMSAALFRRYCREAGLRCVSQEIVNWIGRDAEVDRHRLPGPHIPLTDCFSLCVRAAGPATTHVAINRGFVDEWRRLIDLARSASGQDPGTLPAGGDGASSAELDGRETRRSPWRGWASRRRHRLEGWYFARREKFASAVMGGTCPDCGGALTGNPATCRECDADFVIGPPEGGPHVRSV